MIKKIIDTNIYIDLFANPDLYRDIFIHEHFGVNFRRVWNVIKRDLPDLKEKLFLIIERENV